MCVCVCEDHAFVQIRLLTVDMLLDKHFLFVFYLNCRAPYSLITLCIAEVCVASIPSADSFAVAECEIDLARSHQKSSVSVAPDHNRQTLRRNGMAAQRRARPPGRSTVAGTGEQGHHLR